MLKTYLKEKKELIDEKLKEYLNELKWPYIISEGMKYSVLNGGKRIRPILLLMTLELLGERIEKGLATGCAIEYIHSYSLVHDDLPALDNDEYRRGQLTTHIKFGEAQAILIGDALLTEAFKILSLKNKELEPEKIVEIIGLTSEYSGIEGMIGGQVLDIESEGKRIDYETLKTIHKNKTGKLIKLPMEAACIISGVKGEKRLIIEKIADLLGLAFQIRDDILDVEGEFEKLGKKIGSDTALDKSTYPSIFGIEKSKKILKEVLLEAKDILKNNFAENRAELFLRLTDYLENRES